MGFPGLHSRASQRKYFSDKLESLSTIEDPEEKYRQEVCLLEDEWMAEEAYREGVMQGRMLGLGLYPEKMRLITGGMIHSFQRINPSDVPCFPIAKEYQTYIRARSDALWHFEMDYIDRWRMYNTLFGESSAFAQEK